MSQDFQSNLVHCVIAIAQNSQEIPLVSLPGLYVFLAEAAGEAGAKQLAAGGSGDHIHIFLSLPTTLALSTVLDEIKSAAERWVQRTVFGCRTFAWEPRYTVFSVGMSQVRETVAYIERQLECHRKIDYAKELSLFGEALEMGGVLRTSGAAIPRQ